MQAGKDWPIPGAYVAGTTARTDRATTKEQGQLTFPRGQTYSGLYLVLGEETSQETIYSPEPF